MIYHNVFIAGCSCVLFFRKAMDDREAIQAERSGANRTKIAPTFLGQGDYFYLVFFDSDITEIKMSTL